MNHARAIKLFTSIQARPYSLSPAPDVTSNNCYFKGIELLQKLGIMGYTVRGQVGETYWDDRIIPKEIVSLIPDNILTTHFFTEVLIDGEWTIADPSFQPSLAKYGFTIGSWGKNGKSCFPITRLYTQEESLDYQEKWSDPVYQKDFFEGGGQAWSALNEWFIKAEKLNENENEKA